jgi:hypothetical protein
MTLEGFKASLLGSSCDAPDKCRFGERVNSTSMTVGIEVITARWVIDTQVIVQCFIGICSTWLSAPKDILTLPWGCLSLRNM